MAQVYAILISKGLKTVDDVPESMQEQVRDLLKATL